jgi:putative ABC transport system permease protein
MRSRRRYQNQIEILLGTGATTAIFTIVHAVLLRPLPYPDPHRLVMIWERQPATGRNNVVSLANFRSWQERSRSFTGMAAYHRIPMNLLGPEEAVQVDGARAAGSIGRLPMDGGNSGSWYYRADRPEPPLGQRPGGDISIVTPGYFAAMGIPAIRGRDFTDADRIGTAHVGILNQTAARAFFGDEDPVGKRLTVSWNNTREVEIVGIVGDIRHGQINRKPDPCLFLPNSQQPFPFTALVVRTNGDPLRLVEPVKQTIRSVDPDQGVGEIHTMEQLIAGAIAQPRAQTMLFGLFGALALALTCIGVYGVLAYAVTQRTREIGVRLALGAPPASAFALVLRDGLRLTVIGLAVGLGLAIALTGFMQGLLYEVEPLDPLVLATVTILLAAVAAAACAIPAARAMRVDPAVVLRTE